MESVVGYLVFSLANKNSWTNDTLEDMALGWLLTSAPVGARVGFGFHLEDVDNDMSIGEAAVEYLVDGFALRSVGRDFVTYLRGAERAQNNDPHTV